MASDPERAELWATHDSRLFVCALTERDTITTDDQHLRIELSSSITGSTVPLSSTPRTDPREPGPWRRECRPTDDRHRHITVRAGHTRFTAHLDPVTAPGGWQLDRNQHRITVERAHQLLHDEVIENSSPHTVIDTAVAALLGSDLLPALDLAPLRRIASLAELFGAQQPQATRTLTTLEG